MYRTVNRQTDRQTDRQLTEVTEEGPVVQNVLHHEQRRLRVATGGGGGERERQIFRQTDRNTAKAILRQLGLFGPRLTFLEFFSIGTVLFVYRMF